MTEPPEHSPAVRDIVYVGTKQFRNRTWFPIVVNRLQYRSLMVAKNAISALERSRDGDEARLLRSTWRRQVGFR